jgi:hypothetical protein
MARHLFERSFSNGVALSASRERVTLCRRQLRITEVGDSLRKIRVIPAQAGIQVWIENQWIPGCAGMTI